jgi:hypothetical protein
LYARGKRVKRDGRDANVGLRKMISLIGIELFAWYEGTGKRKGWMARDGGEAVLFVYCLSWDVVCLFNGVGRVLCVVGLD